MCGSGIELFDCNLILGDIPDPRVEDLDSNQSLGDRWISKHPANCARVNSVTAFKLWMGDEAQTILFDIISSITTTNLCWRGNSTDFFYGRKFQ